MDFEQLLWAYIGFAIAWIIAGIIFWFWRKKRLAYYYSLVESYRYETDILNDNFETLSLAKYDAEKRAEDLEIENLSLDSSLRKRQLILIERETEIKSFVSQSGDSDGKMESLRQEVFRKTEQIDVLQRQVQQKSVQIEQFENELETQKTYVAQLHLKGGENLNNPILVEKNNQIANLHTQLSTLLPFESKVSLQNEEIDELRIEKNNLNVKLGEKESKILQLKEESEQIEALISENFKLRDELKKQFLRMN